MFGFGKKKSGKYKFDDIDRILAAELKKTQLEEIRSLRERRKALRESPSSASRLSGVMDEIGELRTMAREFPELFGLKDRDDEPDDAKLLAQGIDLLKTLTGKPEPI